MRWYSMVLFNTYIWSQRVYGLTHITVFIQIDAHALIDAHPLHHQALGTQKWLKLTDFFCYKKMHRSMMNSPYISNYSVLWWCIWSQISSLSFCINLMSCLHRVGIYLNEYGTYMYAYSICVTTPVVQKVELICNNVRSLVSLWPACRPEYVSMIYISDNLINECQVSSNIHACLIKIAARVWGIEAAILPACATFHNMD